MSASTAHSRSTTPVRAGVTVRAAGIPGLARGLGTETVARARELRRRGSAAVDARRRCKTGAAPVVLLLRIGLHGDVVGFCRVVGGGVLAGTFDAALLRAGGGDHESAEQDHADGSDGDDGAFAQAAFVGGVATGVQGAEVGWGGSAGVDCRAAVGCAQGGAGALLDSAHDSGGHGHVEAGCRGSGAGGGVAGRHRVVAAGVDRVKVHVCDGGFVVVGLGC